MNKDDRTILEDIFSTNTIASFLGAQLTYIILCFAADPYGNPIQNWQHHAPLPADHVVSIPPKPTPPPGGASRPPHSPVRAPSPQPPPPPPPFLSSSGGSGSNYSGPETPLPPPSPGVGLSFSKSTFSYEELAMATDGFSDANLLGQGGFGYVHRGVLPNGKEVAVKQLKAGSGQGEREFQAEVEIISRVHHKHLVSLVGYCSTGIQRMLVYEFVPNNTLEFHLHGLLHALASFLYGSFPFILLCFFHINWIFCGENLQFGVFISKGKTSNGLANKIEDCFGFSKRACLPARGL